MKNKIRFCGSLILTIVYAFSFAPRGLMQTQNAGTTAQIKEAPKLALLVGINDYSSPTIRDLNGTHNDVDIVKNLLVEQYKFREDKVKAAPRLAPCGQQTVASPVKTLCSEQATQAAIMEAFEKHLISNAENYQKQTGVSPDKGATVVFYYSGHGSTLPDEVGGDESDGIDETIVAADSDNYGAKDIRDDKFEELFGRLKKFTSNVTFIFDSCHSGTVTRGNGVKSVERNFKPTSGGASRGDSTNLSDAMNTDASYVTISGSLPNEKSQEDYFPIEKPKPGGFKDQLNGALTYYFVQNLRRNPDATYREIMNRVQTTVVNLKRGQTPQAEGAIDRVVFGSGAARQKTPIFVKSSDIVKKTFDGKAAEVNEIGLDVGTIAGAQTGGVIAVYNSKARQLEGDKDKIATGSITFANAFTSKADVVLTNKTIKTVPLDAKVILVTPNFSDKKRKIALDFPDDTRWAQSGAMTRLADALKNNELLETVAVNNLLPKLNAKSEAGIVAPEWDAAVVSGTYKDFAFGNLQVEIKDTKTPAETEEIYFLTNRSGMPLYNFWVRASDENAVKSIRDALESHVRVENLRLLANTASKLSEQIQFEIVRLSGYNVTDASSTPPKCAVTPDEQNKSAQFRSGDLFYVKMTNASEKNLYVYLYSIGTSGKINLLYPTQNAKETLKPNLPFTSLAASGCYGIFQVGKPEDTPLGIETLKLIASTQPFPAELLTSPAIAKATQRDGSALAKLLSQTATNQRSGPIEISVSDWVTKDINIEIIR